MKNFSAIFIIILMIFIFSCSGSEKQTKKQISNDNIEQIDINGDGKYDMVNYYMKQGDKKKLVRREYDLNFDGKIDKKDFFNKTAGFLEREQVDLDFDGRWDIIYYYDAKGLYLEQIDRDFDGRPDIQKRFKMGKLYIRAKDLNFDGKFDIWEYYNKKGDIYKIGEDKDGDGKPEYFENVKHKKH